MKMDARAAKTPSRVLPHQNPKNGKINCGNSKTSRPLSDHPSVGCLDGKSRARQRSEHKAIVALDGAFKLTKARRRGAVEKIRASKRPMAEAKKIIETEKRDRANQGETGSRIDLSDIQELRVRLMRRDKGIWPPQSDCLRDMEAFILEGEMTRKRFEAMTSTVWHMEQALPAATRKMEQDECRGLIEFSEQCARVREKPDRSIDLSTHTPNPDILVIPDFLRQAA